MRAPKWPSGQKVGNVFTRRGIAALGGGAALVLAGITAGTASASTSAHPLTSTATITTVSAGHMDTTSYSGSATFQAPNGSGPVWAIDTLHEKWVITPCADSTTCTTDNDGADYAATLHVTKGSQFAEFADPGQGSNESADPCPGGGSNAGGPHTGMGAVTGTLEYDINSSAAPDLNSVHATQPPNTGLGAVLNQIFDNNQNTTPLIVGGGSYSFSYSKVCGQLYKQTG